MMKMQKVLREENEKVIQLKGMTPDGKLLSQMDKVFIQSKKAEKDKKKPQKSKVNGGGNLKEIETSKFLLF